MPSTMILVEEADNYIAAENIVSRISVAPFRNAAKDGFAVASKKITGCPITLQISATVFAGDRPDINFDQGQAIKIMTGAPVPDQYDTVVPFEDTKYDDSQVTINVPVNSYQNVRLAGEDIATGDIILRKGDLIRSLELGVIASVGLERVSVVGKPRILILSTGNELAPAGRPLNFGQIYDSNGQTLEALTRPFRSSVEKRNAVDDDISRLRQEVNADHDVIITSGGVSMGEQDFLPVAAEQSGWVPLFHKVAIKPGMPIFVATRGNQVLFGLPGNPLSAAVTYAVLVLPALKKMIGVESCLPKLTPAILDGASPANSGRTFVWPGFFRKKDNTLHVTLANKRSSAALSALLGSDGLVFLDWIGNSDEPTVKAVSWPEILHP